MMDSIIDSVIDYLKYWVLLIKCAASGGWVYYLWLSILLVFVGLGGYCYYNQITEGLSVTNMSDQVSWGIGIANFVYFVGVAASAALLVYPAYIKHNKDIKEVVLLGENLAFTAIVMCLLFIFTDVGHPERLWHILPVIGELNVPSSLLAWDVVVFNVYLILNMYIPSYLLYKIYRKEKPTWYLYLPLVFLSIFFAISIHTVTAFLLSGLGTRYFWNTAIMAPRFLISAFSVGPAILSIIFRVLNYHTTLNVKETVFEYLKNVMKVTLPINIFLLGCELFKELYPGTIHAASAQYLYFGLDGHHMLTKFIWTATAMNILATIIIRSRKLRDHQVWFLVCCGLTILGLWVEKGMGLVFPGFIPSPLGEIVEYSPNLGEILLNLGIVALGTLIFTFAAKITTSVLTGELSYESHDEIRPDVFPKGEEYSFEFLRKRK